MHPSQVRRLPLAHAFCYHSAILARHEIDTGRPTLAEQDILKNITL